MELADLEDLDFAAWKNPWAELDDEAPDIDPELAQGAHHAPAARDGGGLPAAGRAGDRDQAPDPLRRLVERRLVQLLDEFGWAGSDSPVRVMSFSWVALRRVRRLAPDLELVMLAETRTQWFRAKPFIDNDWIAGPGIDMVREHPEVIARMREQRAPGALLGGEQPADIDALRRTRDRGPDHRQAGGSCDLPDKVAADEFTAPTDGQHRLSEQRERAQGTGLRPRRMT